MADFIEKVRPNVLTEDEVLQDVWLFQLMEYPFVPAELTNELVAYCKTSESTRKKLFLNGSDFAKDEQTIALLLEWVHEWPLNKKHLVKSFLENTPVPILLKYEDALKPYMSKAFFDVRKKYMAFLDKEEQELEPLWEFYGELLANLNVRFEHETYTTAQFVQDLLIQLGEYDTTEVGYILRDELEEAFFSVNGILAVRAVGLMALHAHIPLLVELIKRDGEDILQEEACKALIRLQSDEVIKAVAPGVVDQEDFIFATSILKNTKTALAEQVLAEAYAKAEDADMRESIIDGLVAHFSAHTFDAIEQFIEQDEYGIMLDMEELFYAFYKAMQREHPLLEAWHAEAVEREAYFEEEVQKTDMKSVIREEFGKVGRNDPCVCGSEKKFKKCCGK